jgi:hypothetical protein
MNIDRRTFAKSLALAAGALALPSWPIKALALRLRVNRVTKIRVYYPPNYNANGPQAFPQSNMVVLIDTGLIPQNDLQRMSLKERAAATMAAGYRVYRVDSAIAPSPAGGARGGGGARGARGDNQHDRPVPYMPDFLDFRSGKVWPNDRPGLGVTVDEKQLTFVEAMTEGASGPTYLRPAGSPTHW